MERAMSREQMLNIWEQAQEVRIEAQAALAHAYRGSAPLPLTPMQHPSNPTLRLSLGDTSPLEVSRELRRQSAQIRANAAVAQEQAVFMREQARDRYERAKAALGRLAPNRQLPETTDTDSTTSLPPHCDDTPPKISTRGLTCRQSPQVSEAFLPLWNALEDKVNTASRLALMAQNTPRPNPAEPWVWSEAERDLFYYLDDLADEDKKSLLALHSLGCGDFPDYQEAAEWASCFRLTDTARCLKAKSNLADTLQKGFARLTAHYLL